MNSLFDSPEAHAMWAVLVSQGYYKFYYRTGGIVFGTKSRGEAGFIEWDGKITWVRK